VTTRQRVNLEQLTLHVMRSRIWRAWSVAPVDCERMGSRAATGLEISANNFH
jgi:hypothetical protein